VVALWVWSRFNLKTLCAKGHLIQRKFSMKRKNSMIYGPTTTVLHSRPSDTYWARLGKKKCYSTKCSDSLFILTTFSPSVYAWGCGSSEDVIVVQFEDILRRFNYQPGHLIQRKFSLKWKVMKDFLPPILRSRTSRYLLSQLKTKKEDNVFVPWASRLWPCVIVIERYKTFIIFKNAIECFKKI
jgi:hypothetical protein